MTRWRGLAGALAPAAMLALAACHGAAAPADPDALARLTVTVQSANGAHVFHAEQAKTAARQEHGLMFRTALAPDYGMLFWPYPAGGGAPRAANFWMKNTPSALDIIFIRADGTIARIADNTVPMSEAIVPSGEPVGAVLEIRGGRALELGLDEGDRVSWK